MSARTNDLNSYLFKRLIAKSDGPDVVSAPKAAGLAVKAADTGRVLMLQRSMADRLDPARGKLEFPGGCLEPGEDALDGAIREWQEETGQKLPKGRHAGAWTSPNGVYRGFLMFVPSEDSVPTGALRKQIIANPDDPDLSEAILWVDPKLIQDNVLTRKEVRNSTDWTVLFSKPQGSDKETAQQWSNAAVGPNVDRSPLHHGPEGPSTPASPGPTEAERFATGYVTVQPQDKRLKVLVADSPAKRALGLQNTADLEDHDALLMRWANDASGTVLHNRNVPFAVSASFWDSSGMFRDAFHMLPDDATAKSTQSSHRYVLEMKKDDHDSLGIGPGCSMDMGTDPDSAIQLS